MTRVCLAVILGLTVAACGGASTSPSSASGVNVAFSITNLVFGGGTAAAAGRIVSVNYTGWLYDSSKADNKGAQFDTSVGRGPFSFVLGAGQVIAGWDQGVVGMQVGGQRRLIIPPSLGYGGTTVGPIPGNSTLVFDIQLLNVQ